jgi:hypothetical protein
MNADFFRKDAKPLNSHSLRTFNHNFGKFVVLALASSSASGSFGHVVVTDIPLTITEEGYEIMNNLVKTPMCSL